MSAAIDFGLLGFTGIATGFAIWSARSSDRSATEAKRSALAAEESLELARSERDRAIEPGDIYFQRRRKHSGGVFTFTNVGTSSDICPNPAQHFCRNPTAIHWDCARFGARGGDV